MFHFASLATMLALAPSFSVGSRQQIRDCPASALSCEKSDDKDSEYICRVNAPHVPGYDPPSFKWSVTAGKVMNGKPSDATRIIDVSGVDAEVVTVIVIIKLGLPGCDSAVSFSLKLR